MSIIRFQIAIFALCLCSLGYAKNNNNHGDQNYSTSGLFSGNKIRTSFYNDGMLGARRVNELSCEWPINSGHEYLTKMSVFVGAKVRNHMGDTFHIISEANGTVTGNPQHASSGDAGPDGTWWSFAPLPGFHQLNPPDNRQPHIAMSHWEWSWPETWPDKNNDSADPGWPGAWNSLFGKDKFYADQESYYVMDDYQNKEFNFYPDSLNPERRGLGIQVAVRGLQWYHVYVKDVLYLLYDMKNVATHDHHNMLFGLMLSHSMGIDMDDDLNSFDVEENIAFAYDADDIGSGGWTPVGYMGCAFLETAGNDVDGLDNDDDAGDGSGERINEEMFTPRDVDAGDAIIVINYSAFERSLTTMPEAGITISFSGSQYEIKPGQLSEIPYNAFDDNLNGLIDENNSITIGDGDETIENYVYLDRKYINYFTGTGLDNPLIDESCIDGLDNDSDWNAAFDDVGLDGVADTYDQGEGDGIPTSGWGTVFPGEPNFERTDPDESDIIQMTSFARYQPYTLVPLSDDAALWQHARPGFFSQGLDQMGFNDFIAASGYFHLFPQTTQRIGLALIFSDRASELFETKKRTSEIYNSNFVLPTFTSIPFVSATPGDNCVTITWDSRAEEYYDVVGDPISGNNFEGYRVYKNTSPQFPLFSTQPMEPIAIFDLDNDYSGRVDIGGGRTFDLGNNSGLAYRFVDNDVQNGVQYFYAVTSFNHGHQEFGIPPSQCSAIVHGNLDGTYEMGDNIVSIVPRDSIARDLGDVEALVPIQGQTTGQVLLQYVDSRYLKKQHLYRLGFNEKIVADSWADYHRTDAISLVDVTQSPFDTLVFETGLADTADFLIRSYIYHGFRLDLRNYRQPQLDEHSLLWNRKDGPRLRMYPFSQEDIRGRTTLSNYSLVFAETGADTSTVLKLSSEQTLPAIPVNFRVKNETADKYLDFAFWERHGDDGRFTTGVGSDIIILLEDGDEEPRAVTWAIVYGFGSRQPAETGDSVFIELRKPFTSDDLFEFRIPDFVNSISNRGEEMYFCLAQNYPNPFNGTTLIRYDVPRPSFLKIEIYNILGQKIITLVDDTVAKGHYKVLWLGQNDIGHQVSSGVYFCTLSTTDLVVTKKLLLIR
ncbi:T9SS type A sorting domain-containing protein [candidate division KSB1 bacterium]|nr:T9SS type A sorting domain-containing protein [candidate division KSB1 bacterium]